MKFTKTFSGVSGESNLANFEFCAMIFVHFAYIHTVQGHQKSNFSFSKSLQYGLHHFELFGKPHSDSPNEDQRENIDWFLSTEISQRPSLL
jgi:hypothetical protein